MLKARAFIDGKEIKEKDKKDFFIINTSVNKIFENVLSESEKVEKSA